MIDDTRHARVADFGLLTVIPDASNIFSLTTHTQGGTARWMSPEIIDPEGLRVESGRRTKHSDCYALGMVVYETISGHLPFHNYPALTVFKKVLEGKRPPREGGFSDGLWEMLERCWEPEPEARPGIEDVLHYLEGILHLPEIPPPGLNDEMNGDDDWEPPRHSFGKFSPSIPSA